MIPGVTGLLPARAFGGGVMTPGPALAALRAELAARGIATLGLTITRWQGTLALARGLAVVYRAGWLCWPAGRLSRNGRTIYAVHPAGDPAGAARRLASSRDHG